MFRIRRGVGGRAPSDVQGVMGGEPSEVQGVRGEAPSDIQNRGGTPLDIQGIRGGARSGYPRYQGRDTFWISKVSLEVREWLGKGENSRPLFKLVFQSSILLYSFFRYGQLIEISSCELFHSTSHIFWGHIHEYSTDFVLTEYLVSRLVYDAHHS